MSLRTVPVLHVVVPRRVGGETQVLLHPHPRWHATGRPLLALPATKLTAQPTDDHVGQRLHAILANDLNLSELNPSWRTVGAVEADTVSPTHGVPSRYRIRSLVARLPAVAHGRAATNAGGGRWLSRRAVLARPDLSPTARAVLASVADADLLPPPPPAADLEAGGDRALGARLAAARDGDLDEFAAVVRAVEAHLAGRLRRTATTRALAPRTHDVEDVLAEAFLSALEHLEGYDPARGSATGWLWTIARNAAVSRLRRDGRAGELPPEVAAARPEPAAEAESREEVANIRARVNAALRDEPPMVRRAWQMRMVDEQPYADISDELGVAVGTIATWIHRVRRHALDGALPLAATAT